MEEQVIQVQDLNQLMVVEVAVEPLKPASLVRLVLRVEEQLEFLMQ